MTTFNAQAGFQPDAESIARRLNALESGTGISLVGPLLFPNGSAAGPSIAFASQPNMGMFRISNNILGLSSGGATFLFNDANNGSRAAVLSFGLSANVGSAADVMLERDAANTLAQRNGTAAQTFNLYGTYTDASNYERGFMSTGKIGAALVIGHEFAGTGTGRDVYLQSSSRVIFQSNGVNNRWMVDGSGHFAALADNAFDMGSSSGRARNVYAGGAIQLGAAALTAPAGSVSLGATTTTTVGAAGAASALPTAPTGYLVINVGGTTQRIPYYN